MFINNITEMCGELTVLSSGVSETKYTSELTLTATTKLNGKTILCIAGFDPIGNDTIKVGGLHIIEWPCIHACARRLSFFVNLRSILFRFYLEISQGGTGGCG